MKTVKRILTLVMALCLMAPITSFAGEWKEDNKGYWYVNDDGHYPTNAWQEIDGKHYYFGADGYLLVDTITPDGYLVGSDGAWIESDNSESQELEIPEGVTEQEWREWLELEKLLEERGKKQVVNEITIYPGEAGYDNTGHINIGG